MRAANTAPRCVVLLWQKLIVQKLVPSVQWPNGRPPMPAASCWLAARHSRLLLAQAAAEVSARRKLIDTRRPKWRGQGWRETGPSGWAKRKRLKLMAPLWASRGQLSSWSQRARGRLLFPLGRSVARWHVAGARRRARGTGAAAAPKLLAAAVCCSAAPSMGRRADWTANEHVSV